MPQPNRLILRPLRAASILTTAEVAAPPLDLVAASLRGALDLEIDFTLGSLTNCAFRAYTSVDGVTWRSLATLTLSASGSKSWPIRSANRFLRVTAQGTGTVAGSSAAIGARFRDPWEA